MVRAPITLLNAEITSAGYELSMLQKYGTTLTYLLYHGSFQNLSRGCRGFRTHYYYYYYYYHYDY